MEKLKEELRRSVQAIRSRYEYSCAQFTSTWMETSAGP